jgi:RNA polymerase sigma-70 factor (ECF subfamily)
MTTAEAIRDESAFAEHVERHRRELQVHCYRMTGSLQDSEDLTQETFLRAWRSRESFRGEAPFRAWLYRIATNTCLDALKARPRPALEPAPTGAGEFEVPWLQPYPDELLEGLAAPEADPEDAVVSKETIELAFIVAIQQLTPGQRAVLILRDVLGFRAAEAARMLDSTVESVTSALKRARATLDSRPHAEASPEPESPAERELVGRLAAAFEANDVDAIVALLADDVRLAMPPLPLEYVGRDEAARFYSVVATRPGRRRIVQTRANGQPALAFYSRDATGDEFVATSLLVVTLAGRRFAALTRFDPSVLPHFGLPPILPA